MTPTEPTPMPQEQHPATSVAHQWTEYRLPDGRQVLVGPLDDVPDDATRITPVAPPVEAAVPNPAAPPPPPSP
jgi:hypothetical protein